MGRIDASILLLASAVLVRAATSNAPLYDFLSRPDIKVPRLTIDDYNVTAVDEGYIFMAPFSPETHIFGGSVNFNYGPAIYDNKGDLVWTGSNSTFDMGTEDLFLCEYEGMPHLCFTHFSDGDGIQHSIMNASYEFVRSVHPHGRSLGDPLMIDMHEFNVVKGSPERSQHVRNVHPKNTAIVLSKTVHELETPVKLAKCNDREVNLVRAQLFQEISLAGDGKVLFEWNTADHIDPNVAIYCPGHNWEWGEGRNGDPFDATHLNAVDKDEQGNYYVSARHASSLYKVSGEDGSIVWRLGLHGDDFEKSSEVPGIPLDFNFQHHVRVHSDYPGADLEAGIVALTLFDNSNDFVDLADKLVPYSSGKVILVNEKNKTAVLKEAYTLFPDKKHQLASNQGSFQLLPNGNRLVGGGNIQEIVEYQPGRAEPVFRAHWGDWEVAGGRLGNKINSYRSFRFAWRGQPSTAPSVFAYAPSCSSPASVYVSWNGATDVASWTIWGAASRDGDYRQIASVGRQGFESRAEAPFANFVFAVAHDVSYAVLGRSDPVAVAVPNDDDDQARDCGDRRCPSGFKYPAHATKRCPRVEFAEEIGAPLYALGADAADETHCDPCFGSWRRFTA